MNAKLEAMINIEVSAVVNDIIQKVIRSGGKGSRPGLKET